MDRRNGNPTHGMCYTAEYRAWRKMKERCDQPHGDWGGRGISVCGRWRDSFENFFADVGPKPTNSHSLDRYPNNDGNYEPGNVRWATRREQMRNKRDNRIVEAFGISAPLAAFFAGGSKCAPYKMAHRRINERGWPPERAIEQSIIDQIGA